MKCLRASLLVVVLLLSACREQKHEPSVMFGQTAAPDLPAAYDLENIQAAGELIAATLSGPETYYEYRGEGFGVEYEMARAFASHIGVRLRVEMASDSAELQQKLTSGEADVLLTPPAWQTRDSSPRLRADVEAWCQPQRREQYASAERQRASVANRVRRQTHPPMLQRSKGIISTYDPIFQRCAPVAGMDWRLLAAQCYQESGFDPHAVSWAGAQGLMQLMPSTASHLGVSPSDIYDPEVNVSAAVRYLAELSATFADIRDRGERIFFVLAAYNGGAAHVRDAMVLTAKYGGNPHRWADVNRYILLLQQPAYYRDPVCCAGYLRGAETSNYVQQIRERWMAYRGAAHAGGISSRSKRAKNPSRVRPRAEFEQDSAAIGSN